MSHNIVVFKNSLLGNVFGSFPKFKTPETIDFTSFPRFAPEIFQNGSPRNGFGKIENPFLGEIPILGSVFGKFVFWGVVENRNKIQEVRLCEKKVSKVDVRKKR